VKVLVIGGTGEARELAAALASRRDVEVVSSLAGRVSNPALPMGRVVIGGFGGVDGLVGFLESEHVERVVDASHPFATRISATAAVACAKTGVAALRLQRPAWSPGAGDRWVRVADAERAAEVLPEVAGPRGTAFLTHGRRGLAPFASDSGREYLIRAVDPPPAPLPKRTFLVLDRGPYTVYGETALMGRHGVAALVSKNSGGSMTSAKLLAARLLRVPVVMIDRPHPEPSTQQVATVESVADALTWLV
jgi:precorrin-6A/cobalt-precorrin-6A reductase